MARKPRIIPGPSRLSQIVKSLTSGPRLELEKLRGLKLTLAVKNDHFGARHFVKEDLPRIQYANPNLHIEVTKVPKNPTDMWKPEMVLEFQDGRRRALDLHAKQSSAIMKELIAAAGEV